MADASGNLFVTDTYNHCIRKIVISTGAVSTFAGSVGTSGSDDGTGVAAKFKYPVGIARRNATGDLYVADSGNNTIRKITSAGEVTTYLGTAGTVGYVDGTGGAASFSSPQGICINQNTGIMVIADTGNHLIRLASALANAVLTIAGTPEVSGYSDFYPGQPNQALFSSPRGVATDSNDQILVCDTGNNVIRRVYSNGAVLTIAGKPSTPGFVNGVGTDARFNSPAGVSIDANNTLYIAELGNGCVRKMTQGLTVTTFGPATLSSPRATAVDASGNVYVTDTALHAVRKITSGGVMSLLAGRVPTGSTNAVGTAASFFSPEGMAVDPSGAVFITDTANHAIRKVALDGTVSTFAGTTGTAGSTDGSAPQFRSPAGAGFDVTGNLFVADTANHTIRKITPDGVSITFAGSSGAKGTTNGIGVAARFNEPRGLVFDTTGNLFVADSKNQTIRKITPAGVVSTFAGGAGVPGSTDGTTGSVARFRTPTGLGIDSAGNLYVSDRGNGTVRKITPAGAVSTFAGAALNFGNTDATGSAARFREPVGIAVDSSNNVFVTDIYYNSLRKITPARVVSTVAGQAWLTDQTATLNFLPYGGDVNGAAASATFFHSTDIAFDGADLFVLDRGNHTLRKGTLPVDPLAPVITGHPASLNVVNSALASFSVTTTAMAPTFQWKKNGTDIPSATAATYNIPAAASTDEATYSVVVTDAGKSTASRGAVLRVLQSPVIVTPPLAKTVNQGQTAVFTARATGLFISYQWKKGGVALSDGGNVSGATTPTLTITNCQATDQDTYQVEVTNAAATTPSVIVNLTVLIAPTITVPPAHQIKALGAGVSFTVTATGTSLTYQWYKGTTAIKATVNPTAITATLNLTNVQAADAATYKVIVKNTLGSPSASATLVVVDQTTVTTQDVVQGKNAVFTPRAYGTITGYQWKYNGSAITTAGVPAHYSGFTSKTLTVIKAVDPSTSATNDEGAFTCVITSPAGNLETSATNLRVLIPPVVNAPMFASPIMVSEFFTFTATAMNDPAKFTITGLPSGVTYSSTTGVVSGRPLALGSYTIKITATNAAGSHTFAPAPVLAVVALTAAAQGTYQGPITRSASAVLGDNLGGRLTLTVPNTGVCSGTLTLGKASYSFKGPLNTTASGGPQTSTIIIDNKAPIADYRIIFDVITASRSLTGTVEDGSYVAGVFTPGGSTGLEGWLPTVNPVTRAALAGNYTMAMSHAVAGDDKPQGYSHGSFKVGTTGTATGTLKLADGSVVTFSGVPVGDAGSFPIYTLLYTSTGSLHGKININAADNNKLNASALGWTKKNQTGTTRYFKTGFGPLDLTTFGRRYTIPVSGGFAMGLTGGTGNAKLIFTDDPAPTIAARLDVAALEIKAGNPSPVFLPPAVTGTATNGSHAKTSLSVTSGSGTTFTVGTTGNISGSMILVDQDPTSVAVKPVTRNNKFSGVIVNDGTTQKAYGYHLFEELPSAGFTAATSPYHSAKVVLSATP